MKRCVVQIKAHHKVTADMVHLMAPMASCQCMSSLSHSETRALTTITAAPNATCHGEI